MALSHINSCMWSPPPAKRHQHIGNKTTITSTINATIMPLGCLRVGNGMSYHCGFVTYQLCIWSPLQVGVNMSETNIDLYTIMENMLYQY